jgi:hypothetical protein
VRKVMVELSYKNGAKRITTRLPVIEVMLVSTTCSRKMSVEILLEAQDSKGNVVGEPRPGGDVNPATQNRDLDARPAQADCAAHGRRVQRQVLGQGAEPDDAGPGVQQRTGLETDYTE